MLSTSAVQTEAKSKMAKAIKAFEDEVAKLRAGRANPSLLESVMVPYFGNSTPLMQLAAIHVEGALMLTVKPFEKRLIPEIEKAIRVADLGLNPATSGDTIRVPLPPLSEERRRELIKKAKGLGEDSKVAIRNIRRDSNQHVKDLLKSKAISEDEQRRSEDAIQKLTDDFVKHVEDVIARKEKDLLAI